LQKEHSLLSVNFTELPNALTNHAQLGRGRGES